MRFTLKWIARLLENRGKGSSFQSVTVLAISCWGSIQKTEQSEGRASSSVFSIEESTAAAAAAAAAAAVEWRSRNRFSWHWAAPPVGRRL